MPSPRRSNPDTNRLRSLALCASSLGVALLVSGCAGNMPENFGTTPTASSNVQLTGKVFGGQQPVSNSTVQLYTVGTTGLKSASSPLLTSTTTTDANGNFSINGKYNCSGTTPETVAGTLVYITATGGNPGAGTNSNLTMSAALGSCATLLANASTTFITVNEITTVAAAYALSPFAQDITHIGATGSSPTGLTNAFANAALLANTTLGTSGGASLATGVTVPTTEINTLANMIAACVNTTGSSSAPCTSLFGATSATDTFGAALAIAKNPGASAITALYALSTSTAPFQPSISTAPNDFTIAASFTGGGILATPYGLAIDASGNAWVTNESGSTVNEFSPAGALSNTLTSAGLYGAQGIAVSTAGNVWVANTAGNTVLVFVYNGGSTLLGTSNWNSSYGSINAPTAVAVDSQGNAFVTNFNGNTVSGLSVNGTLLSGSPYTGSGNISVPTGVALDSTGNVYATSGNGSIIKLSHAGAYTSSLTDGTIQGPVSVAIDPAGHILATGFTTGTAIGPALSEFTSAGVAASISPVISGFSSPAGLASDGTSIWVANSTTSGSLAQFTYGSATASSPTAGFGSLNTPIGVAIDSSGSVWTTNSGSNTVSKFIGLAVPVTTPLAANVGP